MSETSTSGRRIFMIPLSSFVTGVILALITVVGGLSAMAGATNPASASETIVVYEAR